MKQEDKELLIKDLCGRLPYGVKCNIGEEMPYTLCRVEIDNENGHLLDFIETKNGLDMQVYLSEVKPYLFPLSSMTEEHKKEFYSKFCWEDNDEGFQMTACHHSYALGKINWLLEHHYDINYLIPTNLAIDCTNLNIY